MTYKIAITGRAGSGKSTFAKMLAEHLDSFTILPFAKPLKDIAYSMGWNGEKDDKGRRLLQLLGTECGRECINENIWVRKWQERAHEIGAKFTIADDCRFDNEAEICDFVINLTGRQDDNCDSKHKSEHGVSSTYFHAILPNKWDMRFLGQEAEQLAAKIKCLQFAKVKNEEARKD